MQDHDPPPVTRTPPEEPDALPWGAVLLAVLVACGLAIRCGMALP